MKSAVKNVPSVFLMTDSQVAEEQFLVLINDLLASGEIPGLFLEDEVENIISSMRPQVKSLGMADTREACWKFFIEKVRRQLKVGGSSSQGPGSPVRCLLPSQPWALLCEEVRLPPCRLWWSTGRVGGLPDACGPLEVSRGQKKCFIHETFPTPAGPGKFK